METVGEDIAVAQRSSNRKHTKKVAVEDMAVGAVVEQKGEL